MKLTPERRMQIQLTLVVVWSVLTALTTILAYLYPGHPVVLAWLIFISCYAIVATHWSGFEGAAPSAEDGDSERTIEAVAERAAMMAVEKAMGMARPSSKGNAP